MLISVITEMFFLPPCLKVRIEFKLWNNILSVKLEPFWYFSASCKNISYVSTSKNHIPHQLRSPYDTYRLNKTVAWNKYSFELRILIFPSLHKKSSCSRLDLVNHILKGAQLISGHSKKHADKKCCRPMSNPDPSGQPDPFFFFS